MDDKKRAMIHQVAATFYAVRPDDFGGHSTGTGEVVAGTPEAQMVGCYQAAIDFVEKGEAVINTVENRKTLQETETN